jgi:hypothetical protein
MGLAQIQSPVLSECARAFKENMHRSAAFALMPAQMAFQIARANVFQWNAYCATTGKSEMTFEEWMNFTVTPEQRTHIESQIKSHEVTGARSMDAGIEFGIRWTEHFTKGNPGMHASMKALFTSIVLESWLFFEGFVSDLWAAGVDGGGKSISNRVLNYSQWEKPEEAYGSEQALKSRFNAKTHPGSFMREAGKVTFTKLRKTKQFFAAAFGEECGKVFDGEIVLLSAYRNCFMHSAGVVDAGFQKNMARYAEFRTLPLNNPLVLDGALVWRLRQAAIETGVALLNHIDSLLIADA